jgi:hypothetical protein
MAAPDAIGRAYAIAPVPPAVRPGEGVEPAVEIEVRGLHHAAAALGVRVLGHMRSGCHSDSWSSVRHDGPRHA